MKISYGWILSSILYSLVLCNSDEICEKFDLVKVDKCKEDLRNFLATPDMEKMQFQERVNKTCSFWEASKACLERLMTECAQVDHTFIAFRYNSTIHAMMSYVTPCQEPELEPRERLINCYIPFLPRVEQCRARFDDVYYDAVIDNEHNNACDSVEKLLECYSDTQSRVRTKCGDTGVREFSRDNVDPLIAQTAPFVTKYCTDMSKQNKMLYGLYASPVNGAKTFTGHLTTTALLSSVLLLLLHFSYL